LALQEAADRLHEDAAVFLSRVDLLALLRRYGEPEFSGSYRLGLMSRRDVDLVLRVEDPGFSLVLDLTRDLRARGFNNYWLFDNLEGGWPDDPRHIICEAWYGFYDQRIPEEDRWSVGISICAPDEAARVLTVTRKVERAIAERPELRTIILRLKLGLAEQYGAKRFSGTQVYEAVLERGVRTIDEMEAGEPSHLSDL
jgi:hypothetical protein